MMAPEVLVVPTRGMLFASVKVEPSVYHARGCRRVSEGAYLMPERVAQSLSHRPAECECLSDEAQAQAFADRHESIGARWARESAEPRPRRKRR